VTALSYILTLEDPQRFRRSREVGCYLGLRPKSDQSGEREPELRISKEGDVYLRKLLVQCAQYILSRQGPDTDLKRWGLGIAAKGKKKAKRRAGRWRGSWRFCCTGCGSAGTAITRGARNDPRPWRPEGGLQGTNQVGGL
jgi:transposase